MIVPRIHHPSILFPLSDTISTLKDMDHPGMNSTCKVYAIEQMTTSCPGLGKEEALIWKAVETIQAMFNITTTPLTW